MKGNRKDLVAALILAAAIVIIFCAILLPMAAETKKELSAATEQLDFRSGSNNTYKVYQISEVSANDR